MSEQRLEEGEEEAGAAIIYETSKGFVGIYHNEDDLSFIGHASTRQGCIDDLLFTLNHHPVAMHEIENDEAELVEVMPLKRTAENNTESNQE